MSKPVLCVSVGTGINEDRATIIGLAILHQKEHEQCGGLSGTEVCVGVGTGQSQARSDIENYAANHNLSIREADALCE